MLQRLDGMPPRRSFRGRGRLFRISLSDRLCAELDRVARQRHVAPEILLTSIEETVLREKLVDAVLDD